MVFPILIPRLAVGGEQAKKEATSSGPCLAAYFSGVKPALLILNIGIGEVALPADSKELSLQRLIVNKNYFI